MSTVAHAPPILETKLRPPGRRPGLVARPDLLARLDAGSARRLTLVTAPAGWGKTTLVGDWLAERAGDGAAWVALDDGDNDPARFWRYVAEALRRAGAPVEEQAVGALSAGGETAEAGLSALLNALAAAPRATVLALDDYHLIDDEEIHGAVGFLCANAPDGLRLVVTSRADPPLGLARLRARGDLAELRAEDLRFSEREAGALLAEAAGMALEEEEVARLRARTEGWAAGLYLAGLSLRGREDAAGFIADFAGDDRLVVDYLADEVLEGLPADLRAFLLRTSVLSRLSGPLCDAVAGTSGSARVLAELESSNLFLVPLDNRREWYRYHHLFGELLQHELALSSPGEVAGLHRRAAAWHLADGSVDDAIHHAAAAGDLAQAADLISENWSDHLRRGWTVTTQRWLELLPLETVRADVRLCLAEAWLAVNLGLPEDADRWLAASEAAADHHGDATLAASRVAARSLERLLAGDAPEALRVGREALAATEGDVTWWRAAACLAAGIAMHACDLKDEAHPVLVECADIGRRTGAWAPALVALCHLADQEVERGDLEAAERFAREALAYAEQESHAEYPHAAGAHSGLGQVLAARGELDAAQAHADRGAELAARGRAPTEIAYSVIVRGEVALARRDGDLARACARDARALLEGAPAPGSHLAQKLRVLEDAMRAAPRPEAPAGARDLTERELAVLRMLPGTASAREIADQLYVSHNTVKTQVKSIYRKLGVATRAEAVARGRELGLLGGPLARERLTG
jgi:LuxR family maltose regulon positive regulatory protein